MYNWDVIVELFIYCLTNSDDHILKVINITQNIQNHLTALRHVEEGKLMNHQNIKKGPQYVVDIDDVLVII